MPSIAKNLSRLVLVKMKSLRAQLILSHILPLLILIPLLGILLVYTIETQVVLSNLTDDLEREALVLAEIASQQETVFQNPAQAEFFARAAGAQYERNVSLYEPDGDTVAVIVETNARASLPPTQDEIRGLLNAETQTRLATHPDAAQAMAEVLVPVFSARRQLLGIVRVSEHLDRLAERLTKMRLLILGAMFVALLVAIGVGAFLANRTAQRLNAVTNSITHIARVENAQFNSKKMPREFRATFDAVHDLQTRLRDAQETRKRLLANLVHELGRPLGALQAAIHALLQGADNDAQMRFELLQGMDAQVERLKPLLDNLASLHGGLSGALELKRKPILLSEWLPKTIVTWREAAEQKKLKWVQEIPNDLPIVNMDADKMAQVLGNLLSNAIKYTSEVGEISLRAGNDARQVWIEIRDSGIGISQDDLAHIFDPFYRGHNARFPQGMGLGLAIARDIVNAHGGCIEVESEVGKGSRFTVFLPQVTNQIEAQIV